MADHTVRYEINARGDGVDVILECHVAPDSGPCRVGDCGHGCEQYVDLERAADGTWSHAAYDPDGDCDDTHQLKPYVGGGCNYLNWYEGHPEEFYDGETGPALPGPIAFSWDGECWNWHYAKEADGE